MAICRQFGELGGRDRTIGSSTIFDDDGLTPYPLEFAGDIASEDVGRTTGRKSDDYAHWPCWKGLCRGNRGSSSSEGGGAGKLQDFTSGQRHGILPWPLAML